MPELDPKPRTADSRPSWWKRHRAYFFLAALGIGTSQWALKQLTWLFGWSAKPVDGHLGQIFDAAVILAAGVVLFVFAIRTICRKDEARQANLDRFHEMALQAKAAKNPHA